MHAEKKPVILKSNRHGRVVESGHDTVDQALDEAVLDIAYGMASPIVITEHGVLVKTRDEIRAYAEAATAPSREAGFTTVELLIAMTVVATVIIFLSAVGVVLVETLNGNDRNRIVNCE